MSSDEVEIVPYQDGPYLVRGPASLRDQDGREIPAGRRTVALCRCGKSRIRPFCDGTHQLIRFKSSSGPEQDRSRHPSEVGRPGSRANESIRDRLPGDAGADIAVSHDSIAQAASLLVAARRVLADTGVRDAPELVEQLSVLLARLEALRGGQA
jgi:CDGSH-type Zn-finger protein